MSTKSAALAVAGVPHERRDLGDARAAADRDRVVERELARGFAD